MLTRRMLPPPLTAASSPLRLARPPSTSAGCVGMGGRRWSKNKTSVPLYIAVVVLWQPRTVTVPALSPLGCRNSLEVLSPRPTQLCRTTTSSSSASAAPSTMKRYGYGDGASNTRVYTRGSPRQPKRRRATSEHGNGEGGGTRRDGAHGNPLFASRRNFHNTAENKQASSSTSSSSSSSSTDGAASASTSLPVYEQLADMWADLCMLELEEAILATFTAKPPTTTATSSIDTTPTATPTPATSAADVHASSTDATSEATSAPPPTTSEASCSSSTIDASIALVKSQYRLLVRQHHPDVDGGDSAVMERINVAYERLERSEAAEWAALQSWVCSPDFQAHNHVEMSAAQIYGYRAVARGSSDIIFAGLACTITWAAIIFSSYYWYSTTPGLGSNATTSATTTAATTTSAATMEAAGSLSANASSVLAQRWWGMVHGSSSNHHNTNTSTHPSQHHARDVVMNVPPRQRAYISEVRSTTSILTAFYLVMTHCAAIFLVV